MTTSKKFTLLTTALFIIILLSACAPPANMPTDTPTEISNVSLNGEWVRIQATLQRSAGPDQPIIEAPFTVLGTFLYIDETAMTFTETTSSGYYLEGAQAELWDCKLSGAYTIPISIDYATPNSGAISWSPKILDTLPETMTVPWENVCVLNEIISTLDDHTPLISSPLFLIEFELLDANTLQLSIAFDSEYAEPGVTVHVERTYIYEREE